jgi:hypothetical protein
VTDKGPYLRVQEPDEREETSSGSSSHSGSPGGGERSSATSKDAEERDEERRGEGRRGIRLGHTGIEGGSEMGVTLSNPPHAGSRGYGSRGDSLGRSQKLNYPHGQLKRYPSNESVSSSSTLVSKLNYEHDDNLAHIFQSSTGRQGLTQSNIQDHLQSEARKNKSRRRSHRHEKFQQQAHPEEVGEYEYGGRKEKFMEESERASRVESNGRVRRRERRGKEEEAEVDEGKKVGEWEEEGGM